MVFLIFVIPSPKVEAIAGVDDAALILLASLAAFGIAVTATGGISDVAPWVTEQFEQYVTSIGDTLSNVWSRFRSGVTAAGKLALDGFTLRYNAKFGEWLVNKFGLTDDEVIPESPDTYTLGGYQVYLAPQTVSSPGLTSSVITASGPSPVYLLWTWSSGNARFTVTLFSLDPFTFSVNGNSGSASSTYGRFWYNSVSFGSYPANVYAYPSQIYSLTTVQINNLLSNNHSVNSSPGSLVRISAGSLNVPGSTDYDDDDGILIDGVGSWGDTLDDVLDNVGGLTDSGTTIVVEGGITYVISPSDSLADTLVSEGDLSTENSPGLFNGIPGGIPDIQFGNLWHYVTDWVVSMSGGLALIGGIMFSLPFVAAFYALVVILLVLSLWRLLRSA